MALFLLLRGLHDLAPGRTVSACVSVVGLAPVRTVSACVLVVLFVFLPTGARIVRVCANGC